MDLQKHHIYPFVYSFLITTLICSFLVCIIVCSCRKRVSAVLQEMLALPQTPSSLVSLLTEKLLALNPDDQRRIQIVSYISYLDQAS